MVNRKPQVITLASCACCIHCTTRTNSTSVGLVVRLTDICVVSLLCSTRLIKYRCQIITAYLLQQQSVAGNSAKLPIVTTQCIFSMVFTCFYFVSNTNALCAVPGECQWLIKQFSGESEDVVFNMNRQQGYSACTAIFPGLRVSDVMDLVRVHGVNCNRCSPCRHCAYPQPFL